VKNEKIDVKIENLITKRKRVEFQEKVLKDKERKLQIRKLIAIGRIAQKAGIDKLDEMTLTGAFLEIGEKAKDQNTRKAWSEKGAKFVAADQIENAQALIVSFATDPSAEMKTLLKTLRFRWNTFRREWHGYGKIDDLKKAVGQEQGKVEAAPE